ncbi:AAA family ATPase [Streptacidiphilus albus]|uniref:AAA family ATPase n=1 Tax=Streptacidiphilus albus TaxID=105425 RepID=UPI00054B7DEE|nr:LuxR family transcriptional regulator [Streptacidiphilus albus]
MSTSPVTLAGNPAPFVPHGRDPEFAQLGAALDRCLAGRGGVVALNGAVGSGRTELVHAFSEFAADSGVRVLTATGSPLEREFPLGIVRQLFQSAGLGPEDRDAVAPLLEDLVPADPQARARTSAEGAPRPSARALHGLSSLLLRLAERTPLLLAVDDRQDADAQSLEFLLYLVRRTRGARVLTLLSSRETMTPPNPFFEVELARQPHHRGVKLRVLEPGLVAEVLRGRVGEHAARRLAADAHALTGGNPLLLQALMEDQEDGGGGGELVAGENYRRALMYCLHRMDPLALRCARGVAVLGRAGEPELLADLLLLAPESLTRAFYLLHAAGLFRDGGFRHPTGGGDLLAAMQPEELAALHRRAARLLHAAGAPPERVDDQLRAADGHAREPWTRPGVTRIGGPAEDEPTAPTAEDAVVIRCVPSLPATGTGPGPATGTCDDSGHQPVEARAEGAQDVKYLFWQGKVAEGLAALGRFEERHGPVLRPWLDYWYPTLLPPVDDRDAAGAGTIGCGLRLLAQLFAGLPQREAVVRAEAVLREARLGRTPVESLTSALLVLVYADRADRVGHWCGRLVPEADVHGNAVAQAVFSALQAEAALRQGDLRTADEASRAAFARIRPEDWGVAVGIPLATMIAVRTALGRYEDAERYLALPVPAEMFRTPAGVHYLDARGSYLLAVGRAEEALADFRACGETMARWGINHLPGMVPWRLGSARAELALDRPNAAASLVERQLTDLGASGQPRVRGMALRIRAAAGTGPERARLLEQAVEALEAAGDQAQTSAALAELGRAHRAQGDPGRARSSERRARQLSSRLLHLDPPIRTVEPSRRTAATAVLGLAAPLRSGGGGVPVVGATAVGSPVVGAPLGGAGRRAEPDGTGSGDPTQLSDAERKVAELAVRGLTNREIARRLYITVSTVEQHLTRVYRKLGVRRRVDLRHALDRRRELAG